jgi:hypothetical protein
MTGKVLDTWTSAKFDKPTSEDELKAEAAAVWELFKKEWE